MRKIVARWFDGWMVGWFDCSIVSSGRVLRTRSRLRVGELKDMEGEAGRCVVGIIILFFRGAAVM